LASARLRSEFPRRTACEVILPVSVAGGLAAPPQTGV